MASLPDTGPVPVDTTAKRGLGMINPNRKVEIREARAWCRRVAWGNPRWRFRNAQGMQAGTLNPSIERAILDASEVMPKNTRRDDLAEGVKGLFTLLLRKNLSEDPLAEPAPPKPVEGRVIIDAPPQERPALPPRASIVPPSRPKRVGKGVLKAGDEELR